jgi:hypothetical protein
MNPRSLVVATVLVLGACSRTGTLYGDVSAQARPGEATRANRINVRAVVPTEAFENDWAMAVAKFRVEVAPARQSRKAAADSAEEARLAWDQALAVRGSGANRRSNLPRTSARGRLLWEQMLGADRLSVKAKSRVWEITRKHDAQAEALLDRHTTDRVLTDENGHYVLAGLPTGKVYLYARVTVGAQAWIWFRPFEVRTGAQRVDLTDANRGGWPFVP